jgi:hypothetical protein
MMKNNMLSVLVGVLVYFAIATSGSMLWNGNFNSYTTTTDLDAWSFSNPSAGEYQTYIFGNQHGEKASSWVSLSSNYKNPADKLATKGAFMHVNATSIWNGGQMWRLELIGNFDHNTVQKGGIFYIWSMMQGSQYRLRAQNEHQLVFFEAHFADMKYGGQGGDKLWYYVNGQQAWSSDFPANTWMTFALEVHYDTQMVSLWTINTATNQATRVAGPTQTSVSPSDWHVGILRLPDFNNGGAQDPTPEQLYYSSLSIQTDLSNLPFGGSSGSGSGSSSASATSSSSASATSSSSGTVSGSSSSRSSTSSSSGSSGAASSGSMSTTGKPASSSSGSTSGSSGAVSSGSVSGSSGTGTESIIVTNAPKTIPYQGGFTVNVAYFTNQLRQVVAEVQSLTSENEAFGVGKSKVNGKGTTETTVFLYSDLKPETQYNLVVKLIDQGSQTNTIYDQTQIVVTAGNFTQPVSATCTVVPMVTLVAIAILSVLLG